MSGLRFRSGRSESLPTALETAQVQPGVHAMPASQPSQLFFHFDFRRSLEMHKALAAGIFGVALLLAIAYAGKTWNNYFADSIVYVQPAPPKLMDNGPTNRWPYDATTYESYIQQQIHNVTRPDVLLNAANKIPGWAFTGETPQAAAGRLGRKVQVDRVGSGYQLSIRAKAKDPQRAAVMANAVAASFIESATKELRSGDTQRIEILREERDRIQKELAQDRVEQEDLNKKLGFAAVSGVIPDPIDEQITAIRGELLKARTENDVAAARFTAETRKRGSSTAVDAQAEEKAANDAGLSSMKTALNRRRSELITQMSNLTPNHPLYKQDSDELAKINDSLDKMGREVHAKAVQQIEQTLKADLDRTSAVESKLNAQLATMIASAGTATPRLQRFNDLTTDIQRLQQRYSVVEEQYRNLTLENNAPGAVYMSAAATAPLDADRSKVLRNALIMIVVGLVLAVGAALTAQNMDKRIYIAADLERVLGFAPMAQLPDFYEVGTGVSEEYMLRLAAAVEHAHQQGELKSCIFTSVSAGAGATTVVKRVTGMLEAMGRETVLVDASGTPPPAPNESAPQANGSGLATRGSRSTALLQQMSEEMNEDTVVLTDTAPLLVSGETEYLARFVDSAIVVVESGVTTRDQLRQVAETLHRLDVRAAGFVLNRISLETADSAFRESVKAVERHVSAQTRTFTRDTEPETPVSSAPQPSPKGTSKTVDSPRASAQVAAEPVTPIAPQPAIATMQQAERVMPDPEPTVMPVAEPQSKVEIPVRAAEKVTAPENRRTAQSTGAPLPRGRKVNDAPAVVSGTMARPEAIRVAAPIEFAAAPEPAQRMAQAPRPVETFAPLVSPVEPAAEASQWRPQRPVAAAPEAMKTANVETAAAFTPAPAMWPYVIDPMIATRMAEKELPPQPAVMPAAPTPVAEVEVAAASEAEAVDEEMPYSAASRLGGLRNLLVTLGLRTLNKDGEIAAAEAEVDRPAERPVYAEPYQAAAPSGNVQTESVTATPEFLPPRVVAEPVAEHLEKEPARPAKQKQARGENYDDVETLPSWRGQYRKRR